MGTIYELIPCETCGRTFSFDVIQRHQNICKRMRKASAIEKKVACGPKPGKSPAADDSSPTASLRHVLQQCQYCLRRFNFRAYDRHVAWCETKTLEVKFNCSVRSETDLKMAAQRWLARINYKPPKQATRVK